MPNIGAPGYILLMILALLLFGPNKLPELGRAVGRTLREFKNEARDILPKTNGRNVKASKIVYFKHPGRRLQKFSLNLRKKGCRKNNKHEPLLQGRALFFKVASVQRSILKGGVGLTPSEHEMLLMEHLGELRRKLFS